MSGWNSCGGRGKSIKHVCPSCKGARIVDSHSDLNLHIDRGMPEGAEVVFEGEADESPEVVAGDVIVRVRSKKQKGAFVRKESNLYWKEPISVAEVRSLSLFFFLMPADLSLVFPQALLGFKHTVKGLDGHDIVLSRTGVTQPGAAHPFPAAEALLARFLQAVIESHAHLVHSQASSTSSQAKGCPFTTSQATATSLSNTKSSSLPNSRPSNAKVCSALPLSLDEREADLVVASAGTGVWVPASGRERRRAYRIVDGPLGRNRRLPTLTSSAEPALGFAALRPSASTTLRQLVRSISSIRPPLLGDSARRGRFGFRFSRSLTAM